MTNITQHFMGLFSGTIFLEDYFMKGYFVDYVETSSTPLGA
jgi:hypothetical protein